MGLFEISFLGTIIGNFLASLIWKCEVLFKKFSWYSAMNLELIKQTQIKSEEEYILTNQKSYKCRIKRRELYRFLKWWWKKEKC